jgi:hypothetical protein
VSRRSALTKLGGGMYDMPSPKEYEPTEEELRESAKQINQGNREGNGNG